MAPPRFVSENSGNPFVYITQSSDSEESDENSDVDESIADSIEVLDYLANVDFREVRRRAEYRTGSVELKEREDLKGAKEDLIWKREVAWEQPLR